MIVVDHLYKNFNGQAILEDINLKVSQGEIFCLLGQSGAGKSILLKHLIGILKPSQGAIYIDAENITELSESKLLKLRREIGYLFQEGALFDFMTVFDNVAFPLREHTQLKAAAIREKVHAILELVDLKGSHRKFPGELSGGMQKRVGLARAIILDSKLILCDEPTSGLDPIRSRDISDLIQHVAQKFKCTVVITSHDLDNAFRIADRCALMQEGQIVAEGTQTHLAASTNPFVQDFLLGA